ncbi:serine/threonine-protein kinase, partial [Streptacidiphilus pinicola]|uniref:serine/threonine-protein kinase n=1 Tax=Streptacidiphilus pinicola TaxID=2219663 RepID=UPI00105763CA
MTAPDPKPAPGGLSPLVPGDRRAVGPYRLLGRLGEGGMGIVYLGRPLNGRSVAVKLLRPDLVRDGEARQRFHREVQAASRVADAFTAPVLDASAADDELVWMATSYIPGLSLKEGVVAYGPLPADALRTLWYGLLQALRSVHEAGVVHRDVKPSNVLLTSRGPRLIDFGISMLTDTHTTLTGSDYVVGTPSYMSPEHVQGRPVGPPADVFALGCVMAYAASGRAPFEGSGPVQVIFEVVTGAPELSGLPEDLEAEVRACLDKDPALRPIAAEMLARLTQEEIDRAERRLAQGQWLPDPIAGAELSRALSVIHLDERYDPTTKLRVRGSSVAEPPTAADPRDAVPEEWEFANSVKWLEVLPPEPLAEVPAAETEPSPPPSAPAPRALDLSSDPDPDPEPTPGPELMPRSVTPPLGAGADG